MIISEKDKFLLAEKNGIPIHVLISATKPETVNDNKVFFFNIEELLNKSPSGIENKIMEEKEGYVTSLINYFLHFTNLNYFKKIIMKFDLSHEEVKKKKFNEEMMMKEIKLLKINANGNIIAMVNRNNFLIVIKSGKNGKI